MNWYSRSVIDPTEAQPDPRESRDKELAEVAPRLLENRDFRKFMHVIMARTNYYYNGAEMTPFEQGQRAIVTRVVGTLLRYGGDAAQSFMRESADRYTAHAQKHYAQRKETK